jgi:diaminopimelate decarboxylase
MIFLENIIRDNIISFKNTFGELFENFEGFYSFKANYLPEICKIICSEGIGAEIIGLPELKLALKLGFPGDKILIGGPYLSDENIEESIKNKVRELIVYNLNDLDKIDSIAKKRNSVQNICLRINSQKYDSKLGIVLDEKTVLKLNKKNKKLQNINIVSILSHYTTQMNNMELFNKNIKALGAGLKKLANIGINIKNINLGGGFPEATVMPERQLKKIANGLKTAIESFNIDYEKIYVEPGRYFVGDSGLFITEIINVVKDRWIFLNIGNHICPKFARCSLRFYNANQIEEAHKFKTSIAGILPTDQDVLVKDYFFTEKLNEGDKVIVTNVGAYTLTFSNRFPYSLPNIFLVKDDDIKQIFNPSKNHDFSLY